jgi:hypothetical protein
MKNNVILTLVIAFLMIGKSASATGFIVKSSTNVKSSKSISIKKDNRKISKKTDTKLDNKGQDKNNAVYAACCVKSTFSFTDSQGFCCTDVTIESCAANNNCGLASQQNVALLALLLYFGLIP